MGTFLFVCFFAIGFILISQENTQSDDLFFVDPKTGTLTKTFANAYVEEDPKQIEDLKQITVTLLTENEGLLPTYTDFLNDLEKTCPYYEPSGVSYRDCLYDLLQKRERVVNITLNDLENDIQTVIAEIGMDADHSSQAENDFLVSLATLRKSWKPYRDALCETDLSVAWGGSNQSGMVMSCKLYETDKYLTRSIKYHYDWVGSRVDRYTEQGMVPKTEAFKELIEKEKRDWE